MRWVQWFACTCAVYGQKESLCTKKQNGLARMCSTDIDAEFELTSTPCLLCVRYNPSSLKPHIAQFEANIRELEGKAHGLAGQEFLLTSPSQVAHILFSVLGLKSKSTSEKGRHQSTSTQKVPMGRCHCYIHTHAHRTLPPLLSSSC